jgi:RNA polymerase sigma-70 factor (ECF subfamily)
VGGAPTDHALVRRFLDGDRRAFDELVERHRARVFRVCLRIVGDPEDALDAAQEAFVAAFRTLDRFRGDAAFTTWLHRIAVNASHDVLRRRARAPHLAVVGPHEDAPAPEPPLPDHAEAVVGRLDAAAALARIPEEFRAALVLADVEDLPYEEIAAILGVAVGTVKSRVHRGRVALARAMGLASAEPTAPPPASKEER